MELMGIEPTTSGLQSSALSQLSYSPLRKDVGLGRLELPTSRLSGVCSNQLSYRPVSSALALLPLSSFHETGL